MDEEEWEVWKSQVKPENFPEESTLVPMGGPKKRMTNLQPLQHKGAYKCHLPQTLQQQILTQYIKKLF
jgi:hypothetical protein